MQTSVYVHFPWCLQKCPYCDFATRPIERRDVPHARYADSILRELERRAPELAGRTLVSVFFGGGTPSLWDAPELGRVLGAIRGAFSAEVPDLEITVECNPSSLDRPKAAALVAAGVNRLSVGVQSLDDTRLRFLGRLHDSGGALRALADAQAEVGRVSADLMFGSPGQSAADFRDELTRIVDTGVRHVSAYALTIEPGTRFGELHRKGKLEVAPDETYAETFLEARALLAARGFFHYEVSNHALPGESSRHNEHYWRAGEYLGLGAGAVGRLGDRRWRNDPDAAQYMEHSAGAQSEVFEEVLTSADLAREALMLGLRTREGVDAARLQRETGVRLRDGRERAVQKRLDRGDLVIDGDVWRVPESRWLRLDGIVADLF